MIIVMAIFMLPLLAGIIGLILPAFGYFPPLGFHAVSLSGLSDWLATPGLWPATWRSFLLGMLAAALSLMACFTLLVAALSSGRLHNTKWVRALARLLGPLISLPHTTIAAALLFLLSPSGWLTRLISPYFTGWQRPPADLGGSLFLPDASGWGLVLGLLAKEIPFLLLICISGLASLPLRRLIDTGLSLGYGRVASLVFLVLPPLYKHIRLPFMAVLIYSLSVVDMALILGPSLPAPLAVLLFQLYQQAELSQLIPASAGALMLVGLCGFGVLCWLLIESRFGLIFRYLAQQGRRRLGWDILAKPMGLICLMPMALACLGLMATIIWSFAARWRFPDALPTSFGLRHWGRLDGLWQLFFQSLFIAVAASFLALILTLFWLSKARPLWLERLFLAPLFLPQISFLLGLQVWFSLLYLEGSIGAVIWVHMLFILPYMLLILKPAHQQFDQRYLHIAASLGAMHWRQHLKVKWPMMMPVLASAFIIGVAVSAALYLPTLYVGAGRIETLTLEAVSRASGGGRGALAVIAFLQMMMPIMVFIIVRSLLAWRTRAFAQMRGGVDI